MTQDITAPTIPRSITETRKPGLELPRGTCDCHAHLFGPQSRYRYAQGRRYTPPDATLDDYTRMLQAIGVERAVLVQASVYLTDNAALLDALAANRFPLRGVVAIDDRVEDRELERMHALGVRGIRINLRNDNGATAEMAPQLARRIARFGWHIQFHVSGRDFIPARPLFESLPVDVVLDHMVQVPVAEGLDGATFESMLDLLDKGRCWVKLSAPMRLSNEEYPYADVIPFVQKFVQARPDRMVWATDWPHTTLTKKMPNDGDLVDLLTRWIPDAGTRRKVLVDNPAQLYGF
ncbi:MAG: amidohydrolase family protein [Burkholderiales bacterium]